MRRNLHGNIRPDTERVIEVVPISAHQWSFPCRIDLLLEQKLLSLAPNVVELRVEQHHSV